MRQSKSGKLNLKDIAKGALVAGTTVVLSAVTPSLESGQVPDTAQVVVSAKLGLFALIAYLLKNIFTNSKGEFAQKEPQ